MSMARRGLLPVAWNGCEILPGFWRDRLEVNRTVTVPACLSWCDSTGRVENFARLADGSAEGFTGDYGFNDSDVYKTLEAAAYTLGDHPDPALERRCDAIIEAIARAQASDGYLFTRTMLDAPARRWTDMNSHEMYCGGHLFEAAVAYAEATGKRRLLDVAIRLADHYLETFGPGKRHWVDGHEEVGLALARLQRYTGSQPYLDFAAWHLEERGRGHGRGHVWDLPGFGAAYSQDRVPVRALADAEGHAVRAMYLFSAMTDVALAGMDDGYPEVLRGLWDSVARRKMYVTGGIGAAGDIEGFGPDYVLPNRTAYCETCAAIGLILWNVRMGVLDPDSRYADVVELALYNAFLAGVSLSGDRFFYGNPLETDGTYHRSEWFSCSCCPPNLARLMASLGGLIYAVGEESVVVQQFIASRATVAIGGASVTITQDTGLPWSGWSRLCVEVDRPVLMDLTIRVPGWARSFDLEHTDGTGVTTHPSYRLDRGYLHLRRSYSSGDTVTIRFPLSVEVLRDDPRVATNAGRVALRRGPVVYCAEEVDQTEGWESARWTAELRPFAEWQPDLLGGLMVVRGVGESGAHVTQVPYYAWDNRASGKMSVWLPGPASSETADEASLAHKLAPKVAQKKEGD